MPSTPGQARPRPHRPDPGRDRGAVGSLGTTQWLVLRRHRPHTTWWIGLTALAWVLGLAAFLAVALPLRHPGQPVAWIVLIGLLAGLVVAGTVAGVTGCGVVRLVSTTRGTPSDRARSHR